MTPVYQSQIYYKWLFIKLQFTSSLAKRGMSWKGDIACPSVLPGKKEIENV
jgi:hypothetical protein